MQGVAARGSCESCELLPLQRLHRLQRSFFCSGFRAGRGQLMELAVLGDPAVPALGEPSPEQQWHHLSSRVVRPWHRLAREGVDAPFLGNLHSQVGQGLKQLGTLVLMAQGLE